LTGNPLIKSIQFLLLALFIWPTILLATTRIGIISDYQYCGEREIAWRIKRAAESLGWEAFLDEHQGRKIAKIKNLDWTISLVPSTYPRPRGLNYLTVFHPLGFLDSEKKMHSFYESFDGYLLTVKPEFLEGVFRSDSKRVFSIPFYPTTQPVPYKKVPLNYLVTLFPVWGDRISQQKYKTLYRLLSQSGFVKFYGPKDNEGIIQEGYMGPLPFDGISVIGALQKHGIALVMHSSMHREESIPSGRIFEAAAASTVIISDENPFVKKHFGDTVYYIDVNLTAEEIFRQITERMEEIFRDPEKALEKAKQSHQIFTDNFQMSDQLLSLQSLHKKILNKE
jgi:hypothetical protein